MALESFLKRFQTRQNATGELIMIDCDASAVSTSAAGSGGLLFGAQQVTAFSDGTGDYTFTLRNFVSARKIQVLGATAVGEVFVRLQAAPTTSVVRVIVEADDGTNTEADFQLAIVAFRKDDDR